MSKFPTHSHEKGPMPKEIEKQPTPETPRVPEGLERCPTCNRYKGFVREEYSAGNIWNFEVSCLCEGIDCKECGKVKVPRPTSSYYNENDGTCWHVPHFSDCRCDSCHALHQKREAVRTQILKLDLSRPVVFYLPPFLTEKAINDLIVSTVNFRDIEYELDLENRLLTLVESSQKPRIHPIIFDAADVRAPAKAQELESVIDQILAAVKTEADYDVTLSELFTKADKWRLILPILKRIQVTFHIGYTTETPARLRIAKKSMGKADAHWSQVLP